MNIRKVVAVLGCLADELGPIDKLKACKLLYYIDKLHLIEYGRFVTGDIYFKLPLGPIPSQVLDIINERGNLFKEEEAYLRRYLIIGSDKNRTIKCKNKPDLKELSESETIIIQRVINEYGRYTSSRLVDISHKENSWQNASEHGEISAYDMIDELPAERKKALVEILKEDSDNNKALTHLFSKNA
ncbi:MAG: Panacea domain-containing protein [bacterium]